MSAKDAQNTAFTFDGTAIGGMVNHQFFNGVARETLHRPLNGAAAVALPGPPDYGRIVLQLLRDNSDPGQVKLESSLANRQVRDCVLTYSDGSARSFEAFCLILPTAGSKDGTTPVNASSVTLRISGPVT